ncbi:DUF1311 domain-containing protein [Ensifer sp. T173]|jgi:uncharacterized protein|uniref:DUF1311 domain-containing protein n=2 Tax=Ensifer TaxID=106591 RepID=A0AAW4FM59_9HYPH|nr:MULTISPECIES: lysozyme inhibitor LprI family protein [Ensifer]KQW39778.1 hypothetical protein ASD02_15525 [Ensifer sp. Root1252]KRC60120.1 hypothetical protein ASE32_13895 [Ensifer sp. Root231]KRC90676.1 hypothetical protein ASE47_12615 [Ensifer sp. Root258]MDP9631310.1 uncharacterized protein [Ensifer adhaerens]KQU95366.1 hypothetical protein ASD00_20660 [Ensifer sp. Root31]
MNRFFVFGLGLFSMSTAPSLVQAQEEPSFDCSKAKSQVEKVLCSGGDSGMGWIDQTMADLYKAVRAAPGADAATLESSQRAWLAKRDHCKGSDEKVMNCLIDSYRGRYAELSSAYDQKHLTGTYGNARGVLDSVLFPDGNLLVNISTDVGAPSYDSCSVTFRAPLEGEAVQHVFTPEEIGADGQCTVDLKITGSQIDVTPKDCRVFCGNSASFDGAYKKQ